MKCAGAFDISGRHMKKWDTRTLHQHHHGTDESAWGGTLLDRQNLYHQHKSREAGWTSKAEIFVWIQVVSNRSFSSGDGSIWAKSFIDACWWRESTLSCIRRVQPKVCESEWLIHFYSAPVCAPRFMNAVGLRNVCWVGG